MSQNERGAQRDSGKKPDFVLNDGNLRSATWQKEGEYGPMFNTRITKLYRDKDDQVRETATLNSNDLLKVAELARETHREVVSRKRENSRERRSARDGEPEQFNTDQAMRDEQWHDEDKTRADIKRDRFKEQRSENRGLRRSERKKSQSR